MKDYFPYHYNDSPTQPIELPFAGNSILSFDTNILLNLYSYSAKTRTLWLMVFKKYCSQIFIPYQVAYEYHNNLHRKLSDIRRYANAESLKPIKACQTALEAKSSNPFPLREDSRLREIIGNLKTNINEAELQANAITEEWDKSFDADCEALKAELAELFPSSRIGRKLNTEELQKRCKNASLRYLQQIPPGYKDQDKIGKEGNPYGDALIWFELIEKARDSSSSIIFVTAEKKADWFTNRGDKDGLTCRKELINEMLEETGQHFSAVGADTFLKSMEKLLRVNDHASKETLAVMLQLEGSHLNLQYKISPQTALFLESVSDHDRDLLTTTFEAIAKDPKGLSSMRHEEMHFATLSKFVIRYSFNAQGVLIEQIDEWRDIRNLKDLLIY